MKIISTHFEILEEVIDNQPVYWVLKKVHYIGFHTYTQLIGKDKHGEIPFENFTEANNKLQELCQD